MGQTGITHGSNTATFDWSTAAEAVVGATKLESGSGSSLKSGQSAADSNKSDSDGSSQRQSQEQGGSSSVMASNGEESTASIFLQAAAYLLDVHALKVLHVEYDMDICIINFGMNLAEKY